MPFISESEVEKSLIEQLRKLGYTYLDDSVAGPDGTDPERKDYSEVILMHRLEKAINNLNPRIPPRSRRDALKQVVASESHSLIEENYRLHRSIVEGIDVEFYDKDGTIRGDKVHLIDFKNPNNNDWVVLNQFTVIEDGKKRRPDVVVFVNGLPLGIFELKNPSNESATLSQAYNQLQTYKSQISSLFCTNAILVISDGIQARIGSLTTSKERFMPWRTTDGSKISTKDEPEMPILTEGVFEKCRFLNLISNFTVFSRGDSGIEKIIAGYHQFHAVRYAVERTVSASKIGGSQKIGVIWHTQGSGKSLLMVFYVGQLVRHEKLKNPTIVIVTDRNDLDDQLFSTFSKCRDLMRQDSVHVKNRKDLRKNLKRKSGGIISTTIQNFFPEKGKDKYPLLTNRRNIVVIVDEAHRSQYGFKARVEQKTGIIKYGFAKYLRDALPKASLIGFTGTPLERDDKNTPAVFGNYINIYDISRGIEDGVTVPIYYESRLARIQLDENEKPKVDVEIEELVEDESMMEQERIKRKWSRIEALVGAKKRLKMIARDMVEHFENRIEAMDGKAMAVCMTRRICVDLYNEIITLRPDWHSDDDKQGVIKIVMTGGAADPQSWQSHIGNKIRRDQLARRMKDSEDSLKMVLVCDMWLTGFDAPVMHTMYIDKPMKGHNLMQAIARVNRVFRDKPGGLVVDYIGIAQNLKYALGQYTNDDQKKVGINEKEIITLMWEKYHVVRSMYHGFNYMCGLRGTPQDRLKVIAEAVEWILDKQCQNAEKEISEEGKRKSHRRYQDATLALGKAFALAAASDEARKIRDEVGFFETVRAALVKLRAESGESFSDRQFLLRQLIDRSVISAEIVDILKAVGLSKPDISILSEEFLVEIQQMKSKNLALEALRKLLSDEIRSRRRSNVVEVKKFSERLAEAMARYHANALSTVEVIQELITLAREIRDARKRGEEEGLSDEEIAFYDALAENASAVQVMGNDALKLIAHELLTQLKSNISVDWSHRQSARASMRILVKRILRKYGYPPDLEDSAVQTVLQQAEELSSRWSAEL